MAQWNIAPLFLGTFDRQKSKFVYGKGVGEKITLPFVAWLLRDGRRTVLVDTGPSAPARALPFHHPFTVEPDQTLLAALGKHQVQPAEVDTVILTHLHWDHCFNTELFPRARFLVQREELRYAAAPLPVHAKAYEAITLGFDPPWAHIRYDVIDGDVEVYPGIRTLFTPGHTPGCMSVVVEARDQAYVLCGDTIPRQDNLCDSPRPMEWLPSGLYVDLEDYYASFRRIAETGGLPVPGHDEVVFDQFEPAPAAEGG